MADEFVKVEQGKVSSNGVGTSPQLMEFDNIEQEEEEDRIANVFKDKTIFITGGTGFLGKVLIEKLLRSCSGLKKIYVLIREKKNQSPEERLKEMFNNDLFDLLKQQRGEENIFKQLEAIRGDVILPGLGISPEDRKRITEEIELIYHNAATIRFDEPLRKAVLINTRGAKYLLELARECKKLMLCAYTSTSYCHLREEVVYEKAYPPPADPDDIIKLCEILNDETMALIEKKILGDYPNSYAFSKSLGEHLFVQTFDELPTAILRPSIVIPVWKEPLPGWTDNINGPTGLLIGAGKGVIRTMYLNANGYGDYLPVDIAVNGMLVGTWFTLCIDNLRHRIGHMTSSRELQVTWNEIVEIGRWIVEHKVPFNGVAWYPGGSLKSSRFWNNVCLILFQWIPAYIGDVFIRLAGFPPILVRVQNRIKKGMEVLEYYTNREWNFDNTLALEARALLNEREKRIYCVEKRDIDIYAYLEACIYATRRYYLKTPDDMLPAARRHMKVMWVLDRTCKTLFLLWIAYLIYTQIILRIFSN